MACEPQAEKLGVSGAQDVKIQVGFGSMMLERMV